MTLLIALGACSGTQPSKLVFTPSNTDKPSDAPVKLPLPKPIKTLPFKVKVENGKVCLAPKDYENLAKNQAEILRWVKEARQQLRHYRGE